MKKSSLLIAIPLVILGGLLLYLLISNQEKGKDNLNPNSNVAATVFDKIVYEKKINKEGEIEISVEPFGIFSDSSSWDFKVILDSHSAEINGDLVELFELIDEKGVSSKATSWDGSPPGGHHREGVLKFKPITPKPTAITLRINRVGGIAERNFTWTISQKN